MSEQTLLNIELERHVSELRGLLQSIRRLCENTVQVHAEVIEFSGCPEKAFSGYMSELFPEARESNTQHASYEEIEAILQDVIYSKLQMLTSDVISMLDWDLIECYGLISTAADRKGPFNPLVEHGALLYSISSDSIGKGSFFAVQVANYLVVTGLVEPANV